MSKNTTHQSSSVLGQIRDEVKGELQDMASDTVSQIVQEPKKILESLLGSKPSSNQSQEKGIEDLVSGGSQSQQSGIGDQKQSLLVKRQLDDAKKSQKLIALHRQRIEEEKAYFEQQKQIEEQEEITQQKEEEEKKQVEIVQLERRSSDLQLQGQLRGRLGSKELGKQIQ